MTDDMELVREYATSRSEEAFATLVSRHVDLVYSVALRRLRDVHLAEEVTQATFAILARKAGALGPKTVLSAWLCRTAQYSAADALRTLYRRQIREQEGYMQSLLNEPENENPSWKEIAPLLDSAMTSLGEKDHCAIVLRFFEGKDLKQVGAALGVNENAASARVGRAVEKLRRFFSKQGVALSATAIAATISAHSVKAAPAALAQTATATALAKSTMVGSSTLAKATFLAMKTKTALATAASAALILGAGTYMLAQVQSPLPAASQVAVPQQFPNDAFFNAYPKSPFLAHVDPNNRRTPDSAPPIHIKYTGSANPKQAVRGGCTGSCDVTNGSPLMGKRVRVSSWMKTRDVQGWAGTGLVIIDKNKRRRASDFMFDRPIHGTTEWQQIESVTDVPNEPCVIYFGQDLYSPGEIWSDDFRVEVVSANTPITDNRKWGLYDGDPLSFSETLDDINPHGGHPTYCLATPGAVPPRDPALIWGQSFRNPDFDKYRGHTVRMTGWVKTELTSGYLEPFMVPIGNGKMLGAGHSRHYGTKDWTPFSNILVVPKKAEHLNVGFAFHGTGKVWIDKESVKFEIVK